MALNDVVQCTLIVIIICKKYIITNLAKNKLVQSVSSFVTLVFKKKRYPLQTEASDDINPLTAGAAYIRVFIFY